MTDQEKSPRVLLISMPWPVRRAPSLQLGVLRSALMANGIAVDCLHLNLQFAKLIGSRLYDALTADFAFSFVCDWLFAPALGTASGGTMDSRREDPLEYLDLVEARIRDSHLPVSTGDDYSMSSVLGDDCRERLLHIRQEVVPRFLADSIQRYAAPTYDVVGLSCIFSQTVPSLALARQWKEKLPGTHIVLGGTSVQGDMGREYLRAFPWIDSVVDGEGEVTLPELVRHLRAQGSRWNHEAVPSGVMFRDGDEVRCSAPRPPLANLDESPIPDYDPWFEERAELEGSKSVATSPIYFESSRGCWWGEKQQCMFCGFNGEDLHYRSKSPDRAFRELVFLAGKHRAITILAVDTIAARGILSEVAPRLKDTGFELELFLEVRATLKKPELRSLAEAGFTRVQPGIESFSSPVLRLMKKGTTALQNIQLLRWCRELGIDAAYNVLWGFPGETPENYAAMGQLLPLLTHLQPPSSPPRLLMYQRFSPYYRQAVAPGSPELRPRADYAHLFPAGVRLDRIAYQFEHPREAELLEAEYIRPIAAAVKNWRDRYYSTDRPLLTYRAGPGFAEIHDTRSGAPRTTVLSGPEASVFLGCDGIKSRRAIRELIGQESHHPEDEASGILDRLVRSGFMVQEGEQFLSLPVPRRSVAREIEIMTRRG